MIEQGQMAKVMVVDDEAVARVSLAEILRLEGYQVATAASGEEAVHPTPHQVAGEFAQCMLIQFTIGGEGCDHHPMVYPHGNCVHDGNDPERTRSFEPDEPPQAQDDGLFPLVSDLEGDQYVGGDEIEDQQFRRNPDPVDSRARHWNSDQDR